VDLYDLYRLSRRGIVQLHARPRRPCDRPRGVADERSVDVDEGREQDPEPGTGRQSIPAGGDLSPKEASNAYKAHARPEECQRCSDIDRGRCETGERLWKAWTKACDAAYEQLHGAAS